MERRRRVRAVPCCLLAVALVVMVVSPSAAQETDPATAAIGGLVTDAGTGAPLAGVLVRIEGSQGAVLTNEAGRYLLLRTPPGPQTLRVERIGYAVARIPVTVPARGTIVQDVALATSALEMEGLVVTADALGRAEGELGTATVVGREAIAAQTATTLAGVLELLPGMALSPPGLAGVQQVALRSAATAGADAADLAAFGTALIVDGIPLSNNANLQTLGAQGAVALATAANSGIDLRRIPSSTIERVEVVRGIPSARYGDLTQGAVVVETRTGAFDPVLALQMDARTLNMSSVGGRGLGSHTVSAGLDVARYQSDPGISPDEAQRLYGQVAHRASIGGKERLWLDTKVEFFHVTDDRPERPETNPGFIREVRESGFRLSERATLELPRGGRVRFFGAFDAGRQRAFTQVRRAAGSMPFTDRTTEGRSVGRFIAGPYLAALDLEGNPRMLYGRLEADAILERLGGTHEVRAGVEARREWNSGAGLQFDMRYPSQISADGIRGFDRPRRFDDAPPLATSALYLDDRVRWALPGDMLFNLQAGLRLEVLHDGDTWASGARDAVFQPRLNAELSPLNWLRLRSGWGRTAKVPALGRLWPAPRYYDLVNVNWYADDPAERLAVLTTFIVDPTNPDLGFSVGNKLEAGIEIGRGATSVAVVGFRERVDGAVGLRPEPNWLPLDRYQLTDSIAGTGRPPEVIDPPFRTDTIPILVQRPSNNTELTTEGVEITALLPEIPWIRLRMVAVGAWVRTRQERTDLDFGSATQFRDFQHSATMQRIPYWDGPVREGKQVLATYRLVHHQPRVGLVITAAIQHNFREETRQEAATDTLAFRGYLTRAGEVVEVPPEQRGLPEYADLRRPRSAFVVDQSAPPDWFMNLQVTKTLPVGGRLTFWAYNALDRRGYYAEAGVAPRLYPPTRFGLEVQVAPGAILGGRQ